jgi:hypothetical protein
MDINCRVVEAGIVHTVTAQFDITDVKIKLLDFSRTAWKIIRAPSG